MFLACHGYLKVNSLEACRQSLPADGNFKGIRKASPWYPVAVIVEAEGGTGYRYGLPQDLILAFDNGAAMVAGGRVIAQQVREPFKKRKFRGLGIRRRSPAPVGIPVGKMGQRDAPQALACRVTRCKRLKLRVTEPELGQSLPICCGAAAIHIHFCKPPACSQDADHKAVI